MEIFICCATTYDGVVEEVCSAAHPTFCFSGFEPKQTDKVHKAYRGTEHMNEND